MPIRLDEIDFSPYGSYHAFDYKRHTLCESEEPILKRPLYLGITKCGSMPFVSLLMERHISTEELLFPGDKPLVLAIANSDPEDKPRTDDVIAFYLRPGELVALKPGVWHDACRAVQGDTYYYFMAKNDGSPRETEWVGIAPEGVRIAMRSQSNGLAIKPEEERTCNYRR